MSQNNATTRPPRAQSPAAPLATSSVNGHAGLFWLGVVALVVAIAASVILALDHFDLTRAPGCGPQSGCDKATRGPWGKIPVVNWPVSLFGVAYFTSLLAGWCITRGRTSTSFRLLALAGDIGSLVFIGVMIVGGYLCKYCLVIHIANFGFVAIAFMAARRFAIANRPAAALLRGEFAVALSVFVVITAALAIANVRTTAIREQRDEAARSQTAQTIIEKPAAISDPTAALHTPPGGFTGRWRIGPENAPIRIVIFSDYQCVDCRAFEAQVRQVIATRNDVSVSMKHFPMCSDCNRHINRNIHPNACWAARAAETAGNLYGVDGFWKMSEWLFEKRGTFVTRADLEEGLRRCGFDTARFLAAFGSEAPLEVIKQDIEEAMSLGLFFTPMVFINGVELRGYNHPTALQRTVEQVAASNPPPGTPLDDRPPLAVGKAVGDFVEERVRPIPSKANDWAIGPQNAPIQIVVYGDYQTAETKSLDQTIRAAMAQQNDVRYVYRHYPMDQSCNTNMSQTISPQGCWAMRAAEAAGELAGIDGFWKMHEWLLANATQLNDAALRQAAPGMGFDPDALIAAMQSPQLHARLSADVAANKPMILQGVPTVYVNSKWVPRLKIGEVSIMELIFKELRAKSAGS